jgi:hypothetical protein
MHCFHRDGCSGEGGDYRVGTDPCVYTLWGLDLILLESWPAAALYQPPIQATLGKLWNKR